MLSISSIGSASGASNYYGKDDYYLSGEADSPGLSWGGEGAEKAGLSGTTNPNEFRQVLDGSHPAFNGGNQTAPDPKHRAGWDMTFSAPKTVSMLALVGGDKRLVDAHRQANMSAMKYAEKNFGMTRVRQGDGTIQPVRTGNLVIATTEHQTSRAGDPQLHSHNIVANKTWDAATSTWRAVESSNIYQHQKMLGLVYRAELAKNVMALGYDVVKDSKDGTFEIAGIDRKAVEVFSKRHMEIEARIEKLEKERGRSLTPAERDAVVLKDRPKKLDHPRAELEGMWKESAKQAGMNLDGVTAQARDQKQGVDVSPRTSGLVNDLASRLSEIIGKLTGKPTSTNDPYAVGANTRTDTVLSKAVSFGLRVLEQGSTVFSKHDVLYEAMKIAPAGVTAKNLERPLAALRADQRVQQADKRVLDGITTKTALQVERGIIGNIAAGKNSVEPIYTPAAATDALANAQSKEGSIKLDPSQQTAALHLLTSRDKYTGIQGSAGVGKTAMFKVVREAAPDVQFIGLAAQHDAAQVLFKGAGINSRTIESFLQNVERTATRTTPQALQKMKATYANVTLLVDESSMQSNAQMARLQSAIEVSGIKRTFFVGDERQLGSVEAGAPFSYALEKNLDHAKMDNIRRQKDPQLLAAVKDLAKGDVTPGVRKAGAFIQELGRSASEKDYAGRAHEAWKDLRSEGRDAAIIVPTNALRGAVSNEIRKTLINEGQLGKDAETRNVLRTVNLSSAELQNSKSYTEGHSLVFHRGDQKLGIKKDEAATIVGRDHRNNSLLVERKDGHKATISLDAFAAKGRQTFQVYKAGTLEVRQGEKLVWDRLSQTKKGGQLVRDFKVGQSFTVESKNDKEWVIRDEDGKQHTVPANDTALRHISHGYAETADRSQGKTYSDVIAVLGSNHGLAATASRLYVQMSRAAETFKLITNDTKSLVMRLNQQDGLNYVANRELADAVTNLEAVASADQKLQLDRAQDPEAKIMPEEGDKHALEQTGIEAPEPATEGKQQDVAEGSKDSQPHDQKASEPSREETATDKSQEREMAISEPAKSEPVHSL